VTDIWDQRIAGLFGREGPFSQDANDHGGATAWGITEAVARAFGYAGAMRDLTRTQAAAIYRQRYVVQPRLDQLEPIDSALAARLFDIGVNCGPPTGIRFLQRALNVLNRSGALFRDISVDGVLGAMTLAALQEFIATRGDDGRRVLLGMVTAQQSVRYIEIAEHDASQVDFEFGWQLHRALGAIG
jgi:lysozyme family protein